MRPCQLLRVYVTTTLKFSVTELTRAFVFVFGQFNSSDSWRNDMVLFLDMYVFGFDHVYVHFSIIGRAADYLIQSS